MDATKYLSETTRNDAMTPRRTVLKSHDNPLRRKATDYVAERRSVSTCAMKLGVCKRSLNDTTNYVAAG